MNDKPGEWKIAEWRERYEVNDKGSPAGPDDKLRTSPLRYVRSKVFGRRHGEGWELLMELCSVYPLDSHQASISHAFECFGVFHKLLEIAADQPVELRGSLPFIDRLARLLKYQHQLKPRLIKILELLGDDSLGWILRVAPRNSREIPKTPRPLIKLSKAKLTKVKQRKVIVYSKEFERFWDTYPLHKAKKPAFKEWQRLAPDPELIEEIIRAIEKQKKWPQWATDRIIPLPSTWLHQERWNDEEPPRPLSPQEKLKQEHRDQMARIHGDNQNE